MDAAACRSQLDRLLRDEAILLQLLEQQLEAEHGLLRTNDIDGLERAGDARQDTVARLLRLDDERRQLGRMLGRGDDHAGMAALLAWCDPAGSLADAYHRCAGQAQRCREQNNRNGALVAARLARINDLLRQVNPGDSAARVYGPGGSGSSAARATGRVLSTSA